MRPFRAATSRPALRSLLHTRSPTTAAPLAKFARGLCAPPPTPPTRPSGSFLKSALKKGKGASVVLGHDRTLHATPERAWLVRSLELKGSVHEKAMRPKELCERFALAPRDLRLLTTHGTNLAVRRGHFLFRFPPWTGAVFRDRVVLLLEKPARDGLESPHAAAADVLQAAIALDRGDAVEQPFELDVVEALLRESALLKADRFARLARLMELELAAKADPRNGDEHSIYRLLTLSNALGALEVDVRREQSGLLALLGSDEDMAGMYLTVPSETDEDHAEVELLLEAFAAQLDDLLDRVVELQARVATTRSLEELQLKNERNRIMRVELALSMAQTSLALGAVGSGLFGMNLLHGFEEHALAFWPVAGAILGGSVIFLGAGLRGVSRFHVEHNKLLRSTAALERALPALDVVFHATRRPGRVLGGAAAADGGGEAADADSTTSREALRAAMRPHGLCADDAEFGALWSLLDTDDDGRLTAQELAPLRLAPRRGGVTQGPAVLPASVQ